MKYILFVLLILNIACNRTSEIDFSTICNDIGNSYECSQKIEEYQLKRFNKIVKRDNDQLIITIDKSDNLIFKDADKETDDGKWYTFRDYFKDINSYLITIQHYEGLSYVLIHKITGNSIDIPGLIQISPDKKRIISYNVDLEAGYSDNGFVIYQIKNGSFIKEYELYPDDWGPSKINWIDNKNVEIEKTIIQNDNNVVADKLELYYDDIWIHK